MSTYFAKCRRREEEKKCESDEQEKTSVHAYRFHDLLYMFFAPCIGLSHGHALSDPSLPQIKSGEALPRSSLQLHLQSCWNTKQDSQYSQGRHATLRTCPLTSVGTTLAEARTLRA